MKLTTKFKLWTAAVVLSGGMAFGAVTPESLITQLQAEGYSWIEVKRGLTQIKVEAVRGTDKVEMVIDIETGAVLKREVEAAGDDAGRTGVQVRDENKDFVGVRDGGGDDNGNDDSNGDDSGGDDSGGDDSGGDDSNGDDSSGDDSGGDDSGGDDSNGDDSGDDSNDDSGSDDSGGDDSGGDDSSGDDSGNDGEDN